MQYESLEEKLARIIGREKIVPSERKEEYSVDMAGFEGMPLLVVTPYSEEDVVKIVNFASEEGIPLVPRGAGSSLTGAAVLEGSIVIDMRKMNKIISVDTVNYYARVQPGVTISELNKELENHGFFFPPDPASSYICTIGGAIAEDSGGMRCLKYGTVKDWVLSLRVVLPNGKTVQVGEPLRKNRAGYDLVHLFVGSEGTLGVITEACVKIIPIPEVKRKRFLVNFESWKDACDAIIRLRSSRILPDIFEFLDEDTLSLINKSMGYSFDERPTVIMDVEDDEVQETIKILEECNAKKIREAETKEEMENFYSARSVAYLAIKASSSGVWAEDIVVPIEKLSSYLNEVKRISAKYGLRIPTGGHAGDGNVHPTIMYDKTSRQSYEKAVKAFEELCKIAISMGGSVSGEHGIGIQKISVLREQATLHYGEEALRIMKEIKKLLDPRNIMNPGKFVDAA